jgi:hypothetical protein
MKADFKVGVSKIRFGFRVFRSGFILDKERIKYGFLLFWRGVLDSLKITNYPDIKGGRG